MKKRGPLTGFSLVEYALLAVLLAIIALVAITLAGSPVANDSETVNIPENVLNVETYEIGHYAGTILRWEDPEYDVVCWTRKDGRSGGGVSCIPKSQLVPLGPTVVPSNK